MTTLILGDCLEAMRAMPDASVDAVVTDPPYGLGKAPDALAMLRDWLNTGHYEVKGSGFMGKEWDAFVPQPALWKECLRVLKPGGHLLAFAGSRTQDLMGLSLRIAGFQIRDCVSWIYGSGFPKSLDVGKALNKQAGAEREVVGVKWADKYPNGPGGVGFHGGPGEYSQTGRAPEPLTAPATDLAKQWEGWGTALKPAYEPCILARKPLIGTVASNVTEYGTGAINIDGCRVETSDNLNGGTYSKGQVKSNLPGDVRALASAGKHGAGAPRLTGQYQQPTGRWPANVVLDEVAVEMLDEQSGEAKPKPGREGRKGGSGFGMFDDSKSASTHGVWPADPEGGPSRFFYTAKASSAERELEDGSRSTHPTVKPVDLMRWLVRLVTPPGGVVLDPFMGSGSTGVACVEEGFRFIGIERKPEYHAIAVARLAAATRQGRLDL